MYRAVSCSAFGMGFLYGHDLLRRCCLIEENGIMCAPRISNKLCCILYDVN